MMELETKRSQYLRRHSALKTERASWDASWRELSLYIQPRRSRFFTNERNKGTKKNQKIINGAPTLAARALAAGMHAGITSPARQWFRLTTEDPDLADFRTVRSWRHTTEERLMQAFARSNLYKVLPQVYLDLGTPATATMHMEDDARDIFRFYHFPIGSYCLANSDKLEVDTIYREVSMTVKQLVQRFGKESCSSMVQNLYKNGQLDDWIQVVHLIEPNDKAQHGRSGPENMPWRSVWMEAGGSAPATGTATDAVASNFEGFLMVSGYEEFPVMAPRWSVTGEDVYGSGPGMDCIGDAKALQLLERRKAQVFDKITDPPTHGPGGLLKQQVSLLPGGYTAIDAVGGQKLEPVYQIHPQAMAVVEGSIREHENRINRFYFTDIMLMLAQSDSPEKTAREVAELHEEKMLQLGPVFGQVEIELLAPIINRAIAILMRNGELPPLPDEMKGQKVSVEYLSIVAAAQKLLSTSGIERLASFAGNLAAVKPDVIDKVNFDKAMDTYADALGVKPELVRTDDEVAALRADRAKQQQQAAQQQQAMAAAQGAKTLSETDTSGDNALTRMLNTVPGAATAGLGKPN